MPRTFNFFPSAFLLQLRTMERKLNVFGFKYNYFIHDFCLIALQDLCLFLVCLFVCFVFSITCIKLFLFKISLFLTVHLSVYLIEIHKMNLNAECCRIHSRFEFQVGSPNLITILATDYIQNLGTILQIKRFKNQNKQKVN